MTVTITFFDILVLFGLFGGAAMGFYRGVVRQALATLIIYISIVVASLFYADLSGILARWTGRPRSRSRKRPASCRPALR